ncbi:MAG TPA: hypothetical protein VMT42_04275 [candidate division Zixibacteria bacterium]|nr:hypothetical protein [candidate division Zixibacteria bacterium]
MGTDKCTVRAVTFDLWETLLFDKDGATARRADARCRNLAQALNSLGTHMPVEEMSVAIGETVSLMMTI